MISFRVRSACSLNEYKPESRFVKYIPLLSNEKSNDKRSHTRRHDDLFRLTAGFCAESESTLLLVPRPLRVRTERTINSPATSS